MRRTLLALALVAIVRPAFADFSEGQMRYLHGDFAGARAMWAAAAERGDARALYGLGVLYWRGLGVAADTQAAAACFVLAARDGYRPALAALSALADEFDEARPPAQPSHYGV